MDEKIKQWMRDGELKLKSNEQAEKDVELRNQKRYQEAEEAVFAAAKRRLPEELWEYVTADDVFRPIIESRSYKSENGWEWHFVPRDSQKIIIEMPCMAPIYMSFSVDQKTIEYDVAKATEGWDEDGNRDAVYTYREVHNATQLDVALALSARESRKFVELVEKIEREQAAKQEAEIASQARNDGGRGDYLQQAIIAASNGDMSSATGYALIGILEQLKGIE